eukprot:287604-Pelagomonas_calceolata.AAC.2
MIIENRALPLFMKNGLQHAATSIATHTDTECNCCQLCNYPGGPEPVLNLCTLICIFVTSANGHTSENA